jgi:hypothetical protein
VAGSGAACVHLLAARALLRSVGANEAAEYVQRALNGAERHATRLGARPRNIVFATTETRWATGKVRSEHVAGLGSIDEPPSVTGRIAFWQALHDRLRRLANRIDGALLTVILSLPLGAWRL